MVSTKIYDDDLKCIMDSRNIKQKCIFKIVKVMRFTSKTKSSHLSLSITFLDEL
jgi:hypothetical protein